MKYQLLAVKYNSEEELTGMLLPAAPAECCMAEVGMSVFSFR